MSTYTAWLSGSTDSKKPEGLPEVPIAEPVIDQAGDLVRLTAELADVRESLQAVMARAENEDTGIKAALVYLGASRCDSTLPRCDFIKCAVEVLEKCLYLPTPQEVRAELPRLRNALVAANARADYATQLAIDAQSTVERLEKERNGAKQIRAAIDGSME